jgi:hypothetical protein
MAFQIRRAHRFFSSPQDLIALRTSNRANREKVPGTLSFIPWLDPRSQKRLRKGFADRELVRYMCQYFMRNGYCENTHT